MVGTAIVGTGTIAKSHGEAYLSFPERCKLKVLCNRHLEKAKTLKTQLQNGELETTDDLEAVLKREDIRLISICTPPATHADLACRCMLAGKDVLVEKPMAASLEECDRMLQVQRETGRNLWVVAQNRYNQDNWKLKQLLDSGVAGKTLFARAESLWYRGRSYYDVDWRGTWEQEGGGCTLSHGVHQIDLLNWMMGMPETVKAVMGNLAHHNSEMEDFSTATLTYQNGAMAVVTVSLVTHEEGQRLEFQCENSSLSSPWEVKSSCPREDGFPVTDEGRKALLDKQFTDAPKSEYEGHRGQIYHILQTLEFGETPQATGEDGRRALEIITAMYESHFTGKAVRLPLTRESVFYTRKEFLNFKKNLRG